MEGAIKHPDVPLDFSFLKIKEIQALKAERPRGKGKRKPIEKEDDED
jgi:hypothetical protein